MTPTRCVQALAGLLLASAACAQVPFALDTTFRTEIRWQYVNSILPLPDGKVIASGVMRFPGEFNDKTLVRLLPNGQRDTLFYNSGLGIGGIKPWRNDTFYVATSEQVRRILPTGYRDPSFIEMNLGPYFSSLQGGDYHVYPDGRVLISGAHLLDDTARGFVGEYDLIWFSNTGYLDTTRVHRRGNGTVLKLMELPDGGFICSGSGTQFEGVNVGRIFRTDADGVPDPLFQSDVFTGNAATFVPLADGRVYAGGNFKRNANPLDTLRLVRFMPDGSLDPTFTMPQFNQGILGFAAGPTIGKITPYQDGQLFVMGNFQYVNGEPRRGICVVDSTGALTDLFDDCGVGPFTYQNITTANLRGILPYGDDHWIVWGTYNGYSDGTTTDTLQRFVSRLHLGDFTTSTPPLSLAEGPGVRVYPNPSTGPITVALEQLPTHGVLLLRDALGRVVHRQPITGYHTTLTLDHPGVYSVELVRDSRTVETQRLILQP